jgi:CHASE3 domain sensor protein
MPPLDLTDAERLRQVVVEPLISAVRSEIKTSAAEIRQLIQPIADEQNRLKRQELHQNRRLDQIEQRLGALERFKLKIAAVSTAIAVVTGVAWRMVQDWFRQHFLKSS